MFSEEAIWAFYLDNKDGGFDAALRESPEALAEWVPEDVAFLRGVLHRERVKYGELMMAIGEPRVGRKIITTDDLRDLPVGTLFQSDEDCLWPIKHAGKQWQKFGEHDVLPLDPEDKTMATLGHFKDPLPATVIGFREVKTAEVDFD